MSEPTEPIARIEAALSRLGAEHEPPAGWEARVLAATAPPQRRSWWWLALPGALVAAAAVFVLLPPQTSALKLSLAFDPGPVVLRARGSEPQLGDTVRATATGGGKHRAVWVFHNEAKMVVACPGPEHCRQSEDEMTAVVEIKKIGTYQIVVLSANDPLPRPTGHFDEDAAAVDRANVTSSRHDLTIR
jgi:hypothetical protein